ncbi:hypothetical protein [Actinophytocola sp.]|uniref:hypothetical protein n=1 Tax=Actinophytocola sp. TaxID=1872138 RepID=UPI002D7F8122|nr:hypothetical protein [Actinophytocola sp.]HET9140616.1 hypothetical protein [Actinophytocola sp.]
MLALVIAAFALLIAALTTAVTLWAWISVGISVAAAGLLVFDWLRSRRRLAGTSAPPTVGPPPTDTFTPVPDPSEPGEEPTDAADLLVISALTTDVLVVDEHPRYHLPECSWLADKATLPLPISEARQLGFTPCARCAPDSTLAAAHRAPKQ